MSKKGHVVREVDNGQGVKIKVRVWRDKRLRKSARAAFQDGEILVRLPPRLPEDEVDSMVDKLVKQLLKPERRSLQESDSYLAERAAYLNKKHFGNKLQWNSIRWVSNMQRRLGSCTNGGPTDGDIRISDKIQQWPTWVIDYVIAHEIVHRAHPNHSADFWKMLGRYPHVEKALGFVEGVSFAQNTPLDLD